MANKETPSTLDQGQVNFFVDDMVFSLCYSRLRNFPVLILCFLFKAQNFEGADLLLLSFTSCTFHNRDISQFQIYRHEILKYNTSSGLYICSCSCRENVEDFSRSRRP
jgi:hypothetical protein